jgi:thimet oligopeptidase
MTYGLPSPFHNLNFESNFAMVCVRVLFVLALFRGAVAHGAELQKVDRFAERAAKSNALLAVPEWPRTPDALATLMRETLAAANAELGKIANADRAHLTLANTAAALDHVCWKAQNAANIANIIRDTTAGAEMRDAAGAALHAFADWQAGLERRADLYDTIRQFQDEYASLTGEDRKLVDELLRDFHRAAADRDLQSAEAIAQLRMELAQLASEFDANITQGAAPLAFTRAELDGLPASFLDSPELKTSDDQFTVAANVMWQFNLVEENATREETRRKMQVAHDNLARDKNVSLLNRMLALRNEIALRLGYKSWADYRTETQMAKDAAAAEKFINELAAALEPEFAVEVSQLQKLKAADTRNPNAKIAVWDWRYYSNQLKKRNYAVDPDQLRNFFAFERVRDGMLAIYSRIFGLRFDELEPEPKWSDRMQLYAASDAATGEPLGLLYLDLFTHDGKTNVGGTSEIIAGKLLPDGRYQRPVVAVLLNLSPARPDSRALLAHDQVEMLFHEFGHALHAIVTRAKYARFSGTNVPRDFVEAPSQMLQNWVWDKRVLDTFAADYRDSSKRIPAELVQKMKQAKLATAGISYRRQCAFAQADLALHGAHARNQAYDCVAISNAIIERTFLPIDRETALIASFRGMNGYDAAYYGYLWSDAIAADMATMFEKAGYLDRSTGLRLRHEVYEPGGSRDVHTSVEKFLGRPFSSRAFLRKLGAIPK